MGMVKDLNKVKKHIKVGQNIEVVSQSIGNPTAYTEKTFKKTVKEIVPPDKFIDWPRVKFKNDKRIYAVFSISGGLSFRWGGKREYSWLDGPNVREQTLIEKYLGD